MSAVQRHPGGPLTVVLYIDSLRDMRQTHALVTIVMAMLEDPLGRHWGYELSRKAGIRSGVLYPILGRMLNEGWVTDAWEDPADTGGRPPRRYYELTRDGLAALQGIAADARQDARFAPMLRGAM